MTAPLATWSLRPEQWGDIPDGAMVGPAHLTVDEMGWVVIRRGVLGLRVCDALRWRPEHQPAAMLWTELAPRWAVRIIAREVPDGLSGDALWRLARAGGLPA